MKNLSISFLILSILCFLVPLFFKPTFLSLYSVWWMYAGVTAYLIFIFINFILNEKNMRGEPVKRVPLQVLPIILSILSFLIAVLPFKILVPDLKWIYIGVLLYLSFELWDFITQVDQRGPDHITNLS